MPGENERVTYRWTDRDGVSWECDEYDHGPFCRRCRRVTTERPAKVGE